MRYAFAGDRLISCKILEFIMSKGYSPLALLFSSEKINSHAKQLIDISKLEEGKIFWGNDFKKPQNIKSLKSLNLDYIIGIHFPYIIPLQVLNIPKIGFMNLHPAFLPFNKGWHTPSWAIYDGTKYGATLHFMSEELDAGDIVNQMETKVFPDDTANTLYQRVMDTEVETFVESFDEIVSLNPQRKKQLKSGTSYQKKDLNSIRELYLEEKVLTKDLINKLRALTTNSWNESGYFIKEGKKYGIQIKIKEIDE